MAEYPFNPDDVARQMPDLGGMPVGTVASLVEYARSIYDNAVRDLGPDLGGGSLVDLLADNMPDLPLGVIQQLAARVSPA